MLKKDAKKKLDRESPKVKKNEKPERPSPNCPLAIYSIEGACIASIYQYLPEVIRSISCLQPKILPMYPVRMVSSMLSLNWPPRMSIGELTC